jgi:hypothetical protein
MIEAYSYLCCILKKLLPCCLYWCIYHFPVGHHIKETSWSWMRIDGWAWISWCCTVYVELENMTYNLSMMIFFRERTSVCSMYHSVCTFTYKIYWLFMMHQLVFILLHEQEKGCSACLVGRQRRGRGNRRGRKEDNAVIGGGGRTKAWWWWCLSVGVSSGRRWRLLIIP